MAVEECLAHEFTGPLEFVVSGVVGGGVGEEELPTRPQPTRDPCKQPWVVVPRNVKQGVDGSHCVEGLSFKVDVADISEHGHHLGQDLVGKFEHSSAEVDTGDVPSQFGEVGAHGFPRAAAEVAKCAVVR